MNSQELNGVTIFASVKGGNITCKLGDEIVWERGMKATHCLATSFRKLMPKGSKLFLDPDELRAIRFTGRGHVIPYQRVDDEGYPLATATGANPDFKPTLATEQELSMRRTLKEMKATEEGMKKRHAAMKAMLKRKEDQKAKEDIPEQKNISAPDVIEGSPPEKDVSPDLKSEETKDE